MRDYVRSVQAIELAFCRQVPVSPARIPGAGHTCTWRISQSLRAPFRRHLLSQLTNAKDETVDVRTLLKRGPVIVTFYCGGWCPYCNLELKAFQKILPDITAAGATLVAINPEKPDDTLSTAEKNALSFEVLSDVGQKVGRAFGLVYTFSDELKRAYQEFGRDIPATNGADEWALPISATYIIGRDGTIIYAYTDADYRDRVDPEEVLMFLKEASVTADDRRPKRKVG